jgi:hypothetical protein
LRSQERQVDSGALGRFAWCHASLLITFNAIAA